MRPQVRHRDGTGQKPAFFVDELDRVPCERVKLLVEPL